MPPRLAIGHEARSCKESPGPDSRFSLSWRLLRSPEQAPIDRFRQNVTLNRFHYVGARLESVGRWFHVQLGIQRIELEHVVVERAGRGGSRSAVHGSRGADLKAAVGQLRALGYAFG